MTEEVSYGFLSILPPIIAIIFAIKSKQVYQAHVPQE